jgi:hypothetical protein
MTGQMGKKQDLDVVGMAMATAMAMAILALLFPNLVNSVGCWSLRKRESYFSRTLLLSPVPTGTLFHYRKVCFIFSNFTYAYYNIAELETGIYLKLFCIGCLASNSFFCIFFVSSGFVPRSHKHLYNP